MNQHDSATIRRPRSDDGREIAGFLSEAGFTDIEVKPTFGYWSIVTGRKP